jgi:hypothetical protein
MLKNNQALKQIMTLLLWGGGGGGGRGHEEGEVISVIKAPLQRSLGFLCSSVQQSVTQ